MKWWALAGVVAVVFLLSYALWIRPWLKTKPWAEGFFNAIEPIERRLFLKSETILWARVKMLVGIVLTVLTSAGAINITPLLPLIPDLYEPQILAIWNLLPLIITLIGFVDEKMRRETSKPIEIIAMPDAAKTPAVEKAIAAVEQTNAEAVAVVEQTKAVT